ncbi:MAG: nucleotidyltransferase domain-containing protein [Lachnospiraceae bacterium]|nr:nucleotidyltransferase domain-containing protein [Lachnospiraceae bacterium]
MLSRKTEGDEKDLNPKMPIIHKFIENGIASYGELSKSIADDRNTDWKPLDGIFQKILENMFHFMP